jgi:small subunit ribosomal protein S20
MANLASAKKRAVQAVKRNHHNTNLRSNMRTLIKKVLHALNEGNGEQAAEAYKAAVPAIDKMAKIGIIHKNKAARYKSRLNTRVRAALSA